MTRLVDISVALDNETPMDPPFQRFAIEYETHEGTAAGIAALFPGLRPDELPGGLGWAVERVSLSTHNGTHVDAPWHYHPTMNKGERAWSIDEVPLDWFFRPGVKLDFRDRPAGHVVSADEIDDELTSIGHRIQPYDIVLMNTGAGARQGHADFVDSGCGFGREATLHLTDMGVRVVGTDAWSWDAPFSHTARRYAATGDASLIWEGHKAGADAGYCQIEKLSNLDQLPATGFTVSCFPFKIRSASAGWTRAVAIFE